MVVQIAGVPEDADPAWSLSASARDGLQRRDRDGGRSRIWPTRTWLARSYSAARGRISTTELASIVGASPTNVGVVLKELERDGEPAPSRQNRRGPGFYYRRVASTP